MTDVFVGIVAVLILLGWFGGLFYFSDMVVRLVKRIVTDRRGVKPDASVEHPARRGRRSLDADPDADRVPDPSAYADTHA